MIYLYVFTIKEPPKTLRNEFQIFPNLKHAIQAKSMQCNAIDL